MTDQTVCVYGDEEFAEKLKEELKKEKRNIEVFSTEGDILPGEEIDAHAYKNWKALIFYFKDKYDTDSSLHIRSFISQMRMHESNICNIIVVKDENAETPSQFWRWPITCIRTHSSGEEFWKPLIQVIETPRRVDDAFPVGDVAQGLVWNYYYGYLLGVLTGEECFIKLYQEGRFEEHGRTLDKLIILLPKSCTRKDSLNEYDCRVKEYSEVSKRVERAGQSKIYKQTVFRITCPDKVKEAKTYLVLVDLPKILTVIGKMAEHQEICFEDTDIENEYTKFKHCLEQAIDDELRNKILIIEFDDSKPDTLAEQIIEEIEKSSHQPYSETSSSNCDEVEVYCAESECEDQDLLGLKKVIESNNIKVRFMPDRLPGVNKFQEPGFAARKLLIWITKDFMVDENSILFDLYAKHGHQQEIKRQLSLLLPIVKDEAALENTGFQYLKHINFLSPTEPQFLAKVVQAVTGNAPLSYPLGNLAPGLAWAYCLNYLELVLEDLSEEYTERLKEDSTSVQFPCLIILLPTSCHAPAAITSYDQTIKRNTEEINVKEAIAGKERKYNIAINIVEFNKKVYKLMVEFATPLDALSKTEIGMKTQLSEKHKLEQREKFDDLLADLVKEGTRRGSPLQYCRLLRFEDKFDDESKRTGPKFKLSEMIAKLVEDDK